MASKVLQTSSENILSKTCRLGSVQKLRNARNEGGEGGRGQDVGVTLRRTCQVFCYAMGGWGNGSVLRYCNIGSDDGCSVCPVP